MAIQEGMNHEGGSMKNPHEVDKGTRLIAAAPELLEALKRITNQYKALLKDCGLSSKDAIASAEAAIAKAEGKP